jgi:hypothetical protein
VAITHKVYSSRNNKLDSTVYVGELGRLFYEQPSTPGVGPVLRYSDGVTQGGVALSGGSGIILTNLSTATGTAFGGGSLSYNNTNGVFTFRPADLASYATTTYVTNAISAASHPAWSINSGTTSVTVSDDGAITMSAASLLTAFDSDLNIQVANTSHSINIFGEFHVHAPSVLGITPEPIFRVLQDGQVRILVPKLDFYEGGVTIVGSTSSNFISPQNLGVMLHITGQLSQPNRFYMDGNNTYNAFIGRRFNGTVANPTAVVKNEPILRLGAVGYDGSTFSTVASSRIAFVASENYTPSAQGGRIEFYTNATGTNVLPTTADLRIDSHGLTFRDGTIQDTAAIPLTQKGFANGVATLDGSGKVPAEQLVAGALIYKGAWNAATNTPYIFANSGTYITGWEYSVSSTGTQTINTVTGADSFSPGDYIIYNGASWDRIPGAAGSVISFNGRTGSVVMTTTDVINVLTPSSIAVDRLVNTGFAFFSGAGIAVTNNGVNSPLGTAITISNIGVTTLASLSSNITVSANTGSINLNWVNNSGYLTSATVNNYFNTNTLVAYAVTATYAQSFNTGTLVTQAVSATTSTSAAVAYSTVAAHTAGAGLSGSTFNGSTAVTWTLNTATLMAQAVNIVGGYVANVTANNGVSVSASTGSVTILGVAATTSTYGVIKVGSGLSVDTTGTVSTTQIQRIRDAGAVNALTVDYNNDDVILCSTTGALTVSHQNFKAGKVVRVIISQPAKRDITHGVSAANSNIGNVALASNIQTNVPNSVFIQFTSAGTSLALTYAQLVY